MVHRALFIVPKSPSYAGSWLQKSHHEKPTLNLAGTDVRRSRWGRMPLIPFVLRCTHAGTSQGGCGWGGRGVRLGEGGAKGIPMRPSLLLSTKCLLQQLQTQVCDVGKNLLPNIKPPKTPIRSAHHNRVEWTLRFNATQNFSFFFVLILFEDFKSQKSFWRPWSDPQWPMESDWADVCPE